MRSIWITKKGGASVLQVRQAPDPTPPPGYVRIRVRASGLNFADILARLGLYEGAPKLPCVMGYEVSGVVEGMGVEAGGFADGDRVLAMTLFGGHSDVVCVPMACVVKIPGSMSFETAAALPVNYLTARVMLVRVAAIRRDETILVHAAAGGVGTALLQLSNAIGGVRVIGTSSASKHEALRRNGCWHAIDYRTQDYVRETRRLTKGQGVDAVFDPLGGVDWKRGYGLLKPGGRLVAFGFSNVTKRGRFSLLAAIRQIAGMPRFTPLRLLRENRTVAGVSLSGIWGEPLAQDLRDLVESCGKGTLCPIVDSTFPFSRAAEANERIEQGKNIGKILLIPD